MDQRGTEKVVGTRHKSAAEHGLSVDRLIVDSPQVASGRENGRGNRRLDHLDGLRGIAIALVIVSHFFHKWPHVPGPVLALTSGGLGVHIFFALSGYLITGILLREHAATGRVSLRRFYARRTLRIFPAFYVFLATTLILAAVTQTIDISAGQGVFAGLYLANYSPFPTIWWTGHLWTLAVEEQFYLLWPAVLLLLKPRRAFVSVVAVILAEPLIRVGWYFAMPGYRTNVSTYLHTQADALLIGVALALIAYLYPSTHRRLLDAITRYRLAPVAVLLLAGSQLAGYYAGGTYLLTIGWTLTGLCIVVLIAATERPGGLQRWLSWRPLVALGLISYSLYLWQQLFMASEWKTGVMANPLACLAFAFAAAIASRHLVENPALRLKRRFEPVITTTRAGA